MNVRTSIYRALCLVLGIYAVVAVALMAEWTGGRVLQSSELLFFTFAHALLLGLSSLRFSRPARTGSSGALLLTLALALVVVSGATVRLGPVWFSPVRLAFVGAAYIGLRLTALPVVRPEE